MLTVRQSLSIDHTESAGIITRLSLLEVAVERSAIRPSQWLLAGGQLSDVVAEAKVTMALSPRLR
jgi:hypothetical protein